jgi:starch phosphorylase
MKNVFNGGLQLSVLDGWWAEGWDGHNGNGWGFSGDEDHDHGAHDHRDAHELYRLLEQEVVPAFYDRDDQGLPRTWLAKVKASLRTLGPEFCAGRMVRDYEERMYR